MSIRDPGLQGLLRSAEVLEAGPTAGAHAAGGGASDGLQADASAAPCSLSPTAQTQPNQRLSQPQSNQADAAAPGRDEQQAERRASSTFKAQEAFSSLGQAVSDPASPSAVPEVGPGECSHADEQAARVQLYQQVSEDEHIWASCCKTAGSMRPCWPPRSARWPLHSCQSLCQPFGR